jgi:ABC-2 type transport system ATP-binding protein
MLVVENLSKEFKNVVAVDDISFIVHPGRIFGLLGPNGAGKTTTIRTILNIIKPSSGSITYKNNPISTNIFNIVGYLPEERGLYKKSRVIDVINYMSGLKGLPVKTSTNNALSWLKKLGLEDSRNRKIEELSKGNQQKVQFIIAVNHNPEILVLDEPFTGFDPINQQIIRENILSFSSEGRIIILSTHQMETAEKLCNEILLMNNGKEILKGDIPSIKQRFGKNFVKISYSGDPAFLRNSPAVQHIDSYNGYAEVQLKDDVSPPDFLREISMQADILQFSVIEPTLNKIFIDTVKGTS